MFNYSKTCVTHEELDAHFRAVDARIDHLQGEWRVEQSKAELKNTKRTISLILALAIVGSILMLAIGSTGKAQAPALVIVVAAPAK